MEAWRKALNRVCKWRTVFVGWQLGTRAKGDPEADAVRDHRELGIVMRVELNALTALLIKKGVFTLDEFHEQLELESDTLNAAYAMKFPGMHATDDGIVMSMPAAAETLKGFRA